MPDIVQHVVGLVYVMAPAFVGDMAPPFVRYWPWWNAPISTRWLGSHKTVVGFAFGVAAAVGTACVQSRVGWADALVRPDGWLSLGLRMGIGAMAGDSVKSFFKRRVGIAPGRPWIPADQLDYAMGALLLAWPRLRLTASDVLIILLLSFVGHFIVTRIGYWLGVLDVKY
jgi:CDP-2,3-bis-(O-geranylgeranyl)-sn-glycerol synthase